MGLLAMTAAAQSPAVVVDTSRVVTVRGTIDRVVNAGPGAPHCYLVVDVPKAGGVDVRAEAMRLGLVRLR